MQISDELLPTGWIRVKLPEVSDIVLGQSPPGTTYNENGEGLPFFQGNADFGKIHPKVRVWCSAPRKIAHSNDILLSVRAPIGAINVADQTCAIGRGLTALIPKSNLINQYLYYYLFLIHEDLERMGRGSTFTAITKDDLINLTIPLPPLEEQHRIVTQIEKLLARVNASKERLDRVPAIMQQFRQSVMAAACSGRLTEDWRKNIKDGSIKPITLNEILESRTNQWNEYQKQINQPFELNNGKRRKTKYIEPAQIKEQFDNILPNWWTYATVEQISSSIPGSIQSGPFGSNLLHSEFQEEGILVIGIDNVQDGYFSYGKQHRINENKYLELKKYTARPKDVLITVMATIGRCCIVPENIETAIISKHVYRITVNRSIILPEFLLLVLTGDISTCNQILTQIRGQTRPGINGEILKNLIIPVPPIQEQHKIICFVDALFNHMKSVESEVYTGKQKIEEITQSILHQAFTGKLIPLNETSVVVNS